MRTQTKFFLPALLCAALAAAGCHRDADRTGQVSDETSTQTAQTQTAPVPPAAEPPANELRPAPQSVDIQDETPPPAVDQGTRQGADLSARERELAAREQEIAAREQRLRERERQARTPRPSPSRRAPEPAPRAGRDEPADSEPAAAPAPEPREEPRPEPAPAPPVDEPRTVTVTLPAGTTLDVEFTDSIASNTSSPGDTFRVRVAEDVREDGVVAIPHGSEIVGVVTDAVPLKRVGGQAKLGLKFTDLVLPSGATVPIHASFVQTGRNETRRDAATIGGAAAGGAVLGRVAGKGDRGKATIIGAILGAVAGTAIASKTAGEEVVIPEGSVVSLKLDGSIEVRARERR